MAKDDRAHYKVHEIKTLGYEEDAQALKLLRDAAYQVQPLMRRRNWVVPTLKEFYPANANLLGLNVGGGGGQTKEIKIRLRSAYSKLSFLRYESVLGTMLHELVHNVRGPHDSIFYKILDELKAECEELMVKGIGGTGQGFDGPSAGRLGSYGFIPQHNPPPEQLRSAVAKAAEDRAKKQRIMPHGPCKLGGSNTAASVPPSLAAAAAAMRRAADNAWCPCEHLRASVPRSVGTRTTITTTAAKGPSSSGRLTAPDSSRSRGVQGLDSSSSDVMVIDLEEEERLAQIIESDTTGNNPNTSRTSGEVGAGVATIRRGEGSAAGTSAGSFAPVNALPPSPQLWHSLRPPDLHQSVKVGRDKGRSSEHSTPLSAHIGGGRGENIRNGGGRGDSIRNGGGRGDSMRSGGGRGDSMRSGGGRGDSVAASRPEKPALRPAAAGAAPAAGMQQAHISCSVPMPGSAATLGVGINNARAGLCQCPTSAQQAGAAGVRPQQQQQQQQQPHGFTVSKRSQRQQQQAQQLLAQQQQQQQQERANLSKREASLEAVIDLTYEDSEDGNTAGPSSHNTPHCAVARQGVSEEQVVVAASCKPKPGGQAGKVEGDGASAMAAAGVRTRAASRSAAVAESMDFDAAGAQQGCSRDTSGRGLGGCAESGWSCSRCTYLNALDTALCELCATARN